MFGLEWSIEFHLGGMAFSNATLQCCVLETNQSSLILSWHWSYSVICNLKVQLGGADCISQCLFLVLHTTLFGFFVFTLWELVGRSAFWRQADWLISQNWMWAELSSCSVPSRHRGPEEYSDWRELLGLVTVTDMGSWLREMGGDCVKTRAHLNSDDCVVLHV